MADSVHADYAALTPLFKAHSPDEYYRYIFKFGMEVFRSRVAMAGIDGCRRVLDAGCGYGQWAVALSEVNDAVVAFDRDKGMVKIAQDVATHFQRGNIRVEQHDLNSPLPYPDRHFDTVWCWGVIMFVDRDLALREFQRVLAPGGRLWLGAVNSYGRWLLKLVTAANPFRIDVSVIKMAYKALRYGKRRDAFPSLISTGAASKLLAPYGFEVEEAAIDGHIDRTGRRRSLSIFPPRFLGVEGNIEILARKAGH